MSYRIVRHYFSTSATPPHEVRQPKVMKEKVLTLREAQEHCRREDTRGPMRCAIHGIIGNPKNLDHDHQGRATSTYWNGERPAFCPTCGEPTVADWFDGFAEN